MDAGGTPLILLLLLCLVASMFFSAAEMALMAMNRIRVKNHADNGSRRAKRAMQVANRFEQALTTILIGNNIANIGTASITALLATRMWGPRALGWSTIATTIFVFFFCEMLPKSLAKRRSEDVAMLTADALLLCMKLLTPVAFLFTQWSELLKRRFKDEGAATFTEEELAEIIETIEDEGVLEPEEQELVQSAFEFSGIEARDILIPMDEVVSLPVNATSEQVEQLLSQNKLSRFPVYDARRTHVIGMLQANRYYAARLKGEYRGLRPLLLPIRSYDKSIHIDELMREMNARRMHMALIRDEDRKVLGIVTMEDILEELVGEIYDEDDAPPEGFAAEGAVV